MLAPFRSRGVTPYLVGLAGVVVATGLRLLLHPYLGDHLSFSFHLLAVFLAGWTGGFWPAAATAFLSALIGNFLFTDPHWSLAITSSEELLDLTCFVLLSLIIAGLSEISRRALVRARQAENEKDNFLAAVAHEMRSPVSVIYYANSLNRMGSEVQNDQLDIIDRQVHHLNVMIEDLLDVSRVTRGKIKLDRQHVQLSSIFNGAIERAKPLIESHRHSLKVHLPAEPIYMFADPVRIEQVLTNLLTNAAKYTPDGGEIVVRAEAVDRAAILSVRDNGIGISAQALPKVFDMFMQVDGSRDRTEGGLGIGLALARRITELHGGTIRATSEGKNRGSKFEISLPLELPATQRASLAGV
ncbi:MAG TPA: HAMP domain-containing sensor histidine kinase [Lacipirellulaceae bacterium]|nr:HAMP domain-containing sensor histidine kinase [Lacipirellulaceae bacterium]